MYSRIARLSMKEELLKSSILLDKVVILIYKLSLFKKVLGLLLKECKRR